MSAVAWTSAWAVPVKLLESTGSLESRFISSTQDRAMPIQNKRVVIIIQARMTSERLPGKVMLPLNGRSILQYQLERLRGCKNIDAIGIATVDDPTCAPIVALCDQLNIHVTGGSEDNVLSRYVKCGAEMKADVVVRITSDCPLIDPELIDSLS